MVSNVVLWFNDRCTLIGGATPSNQYLYKNWESCTTGGFRSQVYRNKHVVKWSHVSLMRQSPFSIDFKGGEDIGRNMGERKNQDATCLGMIYVLASMWKGDIVKQVVIDVKIGAVAGWLSMCATCYWCICRIRSMYQVDKRFQERNPRSRVWVLGWWTYLAFIGIFRVASQCAYLRCPHYLIYSSCLFQWYVENHMGLHGLRETLSQSWWPNS